jgi:hypothetical protein
MLADRDPLRDLHRLFGLFLTDLFTNSLPVRSSHILRGLVADERPGRAEVFSNGRS